MKTGTTYLQGKAYANAEALLDGGVELAGDGWGEQVWAVQELLGMGAHDRFVRARNKGAWARVSEGMRTSDQPVSLLSMEFLAFADARQAQRVVDSLAGCEVRVVITVRDTASVVPALWQTTVTSGGTTTWPRFRQMVRLSAAAGGRGGRLLSRLGARTATRFAEAVDIPRMLAVWTSVLPPEQVHVVVVPRPGAPKDLLWRRFCEVLGVDGGDYATEPQQANESLGYPSAEVVRRVNAAIELEQVRDQTVVKNDLGLTTLGERRSQERRALLDRATLAAALGWNRTVRDAVRRHGVVVHGDLADLPVPGDGAEHAVEDAHVPPSEEELLAAARHGARGMRRLVRRRSERLLPPKRRKRMARRLRREVAGPRAWSAAEDPVDAAVTDLVAYAHALVRLRRRREELRRRRRS
ncbi:hypothetical protein [Nocardioides sp. YIM 152588]|uniref:hypothetical protein n=1 Tax=Nocardioides sp. YIM 152588 TaxID=3158259 RepID=UPI0032E502FE